MTNYLVSKRRQDVHLGHSANVTTIKSWFNVVFEQNNRLSGIGICQIQPISGLLFKLDFSTSRPSWTKMPKERPARSKTYSSGPAPTGAAGGLGQHFIKNIAVVHNIVEKAGIKPTDIILEIGPGNGILTMELLKKAKKVIAVEVDPRMVNEIQKKVQGTYWLCA